MWVLVAFLALALLIFMRLYYLEKEQNANEQKLFYKQRQELKREIDALIHQRNQSNQRVKEMEFMVSALNSKVKRLEHKATLGEPITQSSPDKKKNYFELFESYFEAVKKHTGDKNAHPKWQADAFLSLFLPTSLSSPLY